MKRLEEDCEKVVRRTNFQSNDNQLFSHPNNIGFKSLRTDIYRSGDYPETINVVTKDVDIDPQVDVNVLNDMIELAECGEGVDWPSGLNLKSAKTYVNKIMRSMTDDIA